MPPCRHQRGDDWRAFNFLTFALLVQRALRRHMHCHIIVANPTSRLDFRSCWLRLYDLGHAGGDLGAGKEARRG